MDMNLTVTVKVNTNKERSFSVSYENLDAFKAELIKGANEYDVASLVTISSERRGVIEQYTIIPTSESI